MKNKIFIFFTIFLILLTLSMKGKMGDPIFYQSPAFRDTSPQSPFENSGSASRYAITEAIVENNKFDFTPDQAKFAAPDISAYKGKVFSLFAPGVSFIAIPFYILGKIFGMPQIFTYFSMILFAVTNSFLVYIMARRLGAGFYSSLIAGFVYLFATNAYPYALSFTQHTLSSTFILLTMLLGISKRTMNNNIFMGMTVGMALLVDVVNVIFLLPVLLFAFIKQFNTTNLTEKIKVSFNPSILALIIGIIPFIILFGIYNQQLTGSPTKLAQLIGNAKIADDAGNTGRIKENRLAEENVKKVTLPFQSRRLLNGMDVLLISNERSWLFYSPVLLFGIAGFVILYKKRETRGHVVMAISIIVLNILTYAMFIDPWGGWAFGPRYLIPSVGILAIGIAAVLDRFGRNYIFIPIFFVLTIYSVYINTLGALTTSTVPPKVEAQQMVDYTPYGLEYNNHILESNFSSSLVYNLYAWQYLTSREFIIIFSSVISSVFLSLYLLMIFNKKYKNVKLL